MDLQLTGLRVLVTGGTRGIGRATVEAFLDEGAAVAFCARTAPDVDATAEALGTGGATVAGTAVDVADGDALAAWVRQSADRLGGIDIVVSNVSALAIPDTEENWTASLATDLMGTVHLVKAAMPFLEASSAASIVAVSSVSTPSSTRQPSRSTRPAGWAPRRRWPRRSSSSPARSRVSPAAPTWSSTER